MAKKDDLRALRKKNQALKGELVAASATVKKLEHENSVLNQALDRAAKDKLLLLDEIRLLKKIVKEATAPAPAGKKIGEWNVVKSGGYYRAFRRIDGKLRSVYLGKNLRRAAQKIRTKEAQF